MKKFIPKRLIKKNKIKEVDLEKKRNEARLNYPIDIRIYLADKNKLCLEGSTV